MNNCSYTCYPRSPDADHHYHTLFLSQACGPLYPALKQMLAQNTNLSHGGRQNLPVKCTILGAMDIGPVEIYDGLPIVASDRSSRPPGWNLLSLTLGDERCENCKHCSLITCGYFNLDLLKLKLKISSSVLEPHVKCPIS